MCTHTSPQGLRLSVPIADSAMASAMASSPMTLINCPGDRDATVK